MNAESRAVFLDRDGVLNTAVVADGHPHPPATAADVVLLPGVEQACHRLVAQGWLLIVVTNQPDIARGTTTWPIVDEINARVTGPLGVTGVMVCPHDDDDHCRCRKPLPGMITGACERWNIDPARSVMVGDRWRDIESGHRAGVATVFVDYAYAERRPKAPDHVVGDLTGAVGLITALWP